MTSSPCAYCNGTGRRILTQCKDCRGDGRAMAVRTIGVDVPGVDDGARSGSPAAARRARWSPGDLRDHSRYASDSSVTVTSARAPDRCDPGGPGYRARDRNPRRSAGAHRPRRHAAGTAVPTQGCGRACIARARPRRSARARRSRNPVQARRRSGRAALPARRVARRIRRAAVEGCLRSIEVGVP